MDKLDTLYQQQSAHSPFRFDEQVSQVFDDMINRSVPGYQQLLDMIALLAARVIQPHSHIYDLGCSHGGVSLSIARKLGTDTRSARLIAIDNAASMLNRFQHHIQECAYPLPIFPFCAKTQNTPIHNASLVILNFTLQFIPTQERLPLLQTIYQGMRPGAVLILSEKIHLQPSELDQTMIELHHDFKRMNGYSELEISRKRDAIENVLIRDSLSCHQNRLQTAGFKQYSLWFQQLNFCSLLAWK